MKSEMIVTLQMVTEYLDNVQKYVPEIINAYRLDDIEKASTMMADLAEGLMWIHQALKVTVEYHHIEVGELVKLYKELVQAIENTDFLLLADLLEYELLPMTVNIQAKIEKKVSHDLN